MNDVTDCQTSVVSADYPSTQAWVAVGLLILLMVISWVDRMAIALLAQPISADLGIGDQGLGLLIGFGFSIVYSFAGVPLAQLLDRGTRVKILATGVTLWGVATIMSGFSSGLAELAVCRAGVAIGEAVLTPAAVSMIADMFGPTRRVLPMAAYTATGSSMAKGSFVVGAGVLALATVIAPSVGLVPWRMMLVLAGAPAIALAVIFLFAVKEPPRSTVTKAEKVDFSSFLAHIHKYLQFYGPLYLGVAVVGTLSLGAASWVATILVRAFGYSVQASGVSIGLIGVTAGVAGSFFWPLVSGKLEKSLPRKAFLLGLIGGSMLAIPATYVVATARSAVLFLCGVGGMTFSLASLNVLATLILQQFGPSRMRARLVSVLLLSFNLIGFSFGPWLIPLIGAQWGDDPFSLAYGIGILGMIVIPIGLVCLLLALRAVARPDGPPTSE